MFSLPQVVHLGTISCVQHSPKTLFLGQALKDRPQGTDTAVCPPSEFLLKA